MAHHRTCTVNYKLTVDDAYEPFETSRRIERFWIVQADRKKNRISLLKKAQLFTSGERVEIVTVPGDDGMMTIHIRSVCLIPTAFLDWGQHKKNIRFFSDFFRLLSEAKYGEPEETADEASTDDSVSEQPCEPEYDVSECECECECECAYHPVRVTKTLSKKRYVLKRF